ncbi:PERQ amino acid-rich with GYF domain-containing 2-like protein [Labeo rohita]|uniref:PERQ amino acid-rich with GYF domain-containing 2-like protein n=1 Tax=Labeo rohita TaxID=84645 RepID=A0A498NMV4_LABRO|nr:PERQ amino acid-rich with GYF domain-containing 2-like protein [Labeo rohita]
MALNSEGSRKRRTEISVMEIPKRIHYPIKKNKDLEHLQALRDFIDKMEDYKSRESGVLMPQTRPGQQELYPDSGLLLSSTKLAAIHQESKKDCLHLFHLLFDQFFTHEECSNSVAFGKHGKVPEGKTILEKSKVNGILTYVMSCGKCHGWKPVEKSKLKKALINKCRMRST